MPKVALKRANGTKSTAVRHDDDAPTEFTYEELARAIARLRARNALHPDFRVPPQVAAMLREMGVAA